MENKKAYHAPSAEIVLLAPSEAVSINSFKFGKNNGWWGNSAWWGNAPAQGASVITGAISVPDEDGNSWTLP